MGTVIFVHKETIIGDLRNHVKAHFSDFRKSGQTKQKIETAAHVTFFGKLRDCL
jgi:hypothetical protein